MNKLWHRKPRNLLQVGKIQNFGPLKFSLDPLNLGFAVLKGLTKNYVGPLEFLSPRYPWIVLITRTPEACFWVLANFPHWTRHFSISPVSSCFSWNRTRINLSHYTHLIIEVLSHNNILDRTDDGNCEHCYIWYNLPPHFHSFSRKARCWQYGGFLWFS